MRCPTAVRSAPVATEPSRVWPHDPPAPPSPLPLEPFPPSARALPVLLRRGALLLLQEAAMNSVIGKQRKRAVDEAVALVRNGVGVRAAAREAGVSPGAV